MGNCDSITENYALKYNSQKVITKDDREFPSNFSSSSLPAVTSSTFNKKDMPHQHKKNNSTEKTNPFDNKQYLLSETISKREDITQFYK